MAYDPQRDHRRPKPDDGPAPIEAILDADAASSVHGNAPADPSATGLVAGLDETHQGVESVPDDPPPVPSVTPEPADPWSDRLLFGMSISTIAGIVVALLVFRWLWVRGRRSNSAGEGD
jgi:hypothetical protein